ncbi:MAG: hypothetical protein LUC35_03960 [Clostridiales bacterium]|nr:hypothetical protein [Clostridiales bacterium]
MKELDELRNCYAAYLTFVQELGRRAAPTDGLLGFGSGPKDDPGHEKFYYAAKEKADALAAAGPSPEEARQAVALVLQAEEAHQDEELAVWMLIAAQGHALALIDFLAPKDADALLQWYQRRYPRRMRLPVQNQVFNALRRRAKAI